MQIYHSFNELILSWEGDFSAALIFGDAKETISRDQLARDVRLAEKAIRAENANNELIITDHTPGTIVRILANVIAGRDLILADEGLTDEALADLIRLVNPDRICAARETLDALAQAAGGETAENTESEVNAADKAGAAAGNKAVSKAYNTVHGAGAAAGNKAGSKAYNTVHGAGAAAAGEAAGKESGQGTSDTNAKEAARELPLSDGLAGLPPLAPGEEGRLIFFTSGTTARSRAVVLTSRSLLCSTWTGQSMLPCGPGDLILCLLPLAHVFGFVCSFLWGLTYGAAIALGRGLRHVMDDCMHFQPTILPVVPSLAQLLMMRGCLNRELATVLVGAAPLTDSAVRMLRQMGIRVYLGYGLTETSSGIAITQDLDNPGDLYPCPLADIRIEPDGEISVATPCLMEGYYDFGAQGRLLPIEGGRFYTGDLGLMDRQGALHLTGRRKDTLILPDGTKIFCPEYEAELADLFGTLDLAVVMKGNRPILVIGQTPEAAKDRLMALLDGFNRLKPRSAQIIDIIPMDTPLPRTATGKVRRWEALTEAAEPDGPAPSRNENHEET